MTNFFVPRFARFRANIHFSVPDYWQEQIVKFTRREAIEVTTDQPSSTTVTTKVHIPLRYRVVTGDVVARGLPWLHHLYHTDFVRLAQVAARRSICPAVDRHSGININLMLGRGSTYEWHVDSNPLTGLLFGTSHAPGEGGELRFDLDGLEVSIHPRAGDLLFFDARSTPHVVMPLEDINGVRVSVPMNYYFVDEPHERPGDLDAHIYRGGEHAADERN